MRRKLRLSCRSAGLASVFSVHWLPSVADAVFTVSVAALLNTLPAVLLTFTR